MRNPESRIVGSQKRPDKEHHSIALSYSIASKPDHSTPPLKRIMRSGSPHSPSYSINPTYKRNTLSRGYWDKEAMGLYAKLRRNPPAKEWPLKQSIRTHLISMNCKK